MKGLWIAVLVGAGILLVLAPALMGDRVPDLSIMSYTGVNPLRDTGQHAIASLHPDRNGTTAGTARTAIFSKNVTPGTRYIVVSLYSGDTADPISMTIITPERTLGPYYDDSDGVVDGRIDLKISSTENLTPGIWKFLLHSNKNISHASLENLSWIRAGPGDHNADE